MQVQRDTRRVAERALRFVRGREHMAAAAAVAAAIAIAVGAAGARDTGVLIERGGPAAQMAASAGSARPEAKPEPAAPLVVDVGGAVARPGVVEVAPGSRVADAIAAAGGLTAEADVSAVNRAAPVADGTKIQVPRVGEVAAGAAAPPSAGAAGAGVATGARLVNINAATAEELTDLPGVGPATARAIVEDRTANGPFSSPEDLMRVSGIGEKRFERLRDRVTV
ncbi:MAG: ComEA family DNA-binding protein [Coriobacteriaceae bacterium]|nr:ComEA family DNA-binding protein [Coriobacteriaceae bacterium]